MPAEPPAWTPSVDDVAIYVRARTKDVNGAEVGSFNEDTRPTGDQVEELIAAATQITCGMIGFDIPEAWQPLAATVVAMRAAMTVEASYFPEQVTSGRSAYDQLKVEHDEAAARLVAALNDNLPRTKRAYAIPVGTIDGKLPT